MSAYIYTIHDVYVGSTTNLKVRLEGHKTKLISPKHKEYNLKIYKYIRENGLGIEMKVIDTCPIDERYIREQEWMDKLQYKCNDIRAYRSPEYLKEYFRQYEIDNKERRKKYLTQYEIDNKERIRIRKAIKFTCECGGKYTKSNITQHQKTKKHLLFINKTN